MFLLLVGCSGQKAQVEPKTEGFACKAQVTVQGSTYGAALQITQGGIFTAVLEYPATVQGTTLQWNGEDLTVSLHGLTLSLPTEKLPGGNALAGVRSVLQNIKRSNDAQTKTDEGYTLQGQSSAGTFTAVLRADGFPVKITLPEYDTTIVLSDFSYLFS